MIPQNNTGHPFDVSPFTQNYECPWSKNRIAEFQKHLDRIAGKSSNGKSNVRLIWPSDPDPAISMHTVQGEQRARYRLWTDVYRCTRDDPNTGLEIVEDIKVDITPPRFVVEEYHEPAEEAWNPSSAGVTGEGFYTHLFTVAHHTEKCCGGTESKDLKLCLGLYHEPNYLTLEELQRRIHLRDAAEHGHRPGERISEGEWEDEFRNMREWKETRDNTLRSGYQQVITDHLKLHGWRLFNHDGGKRSRYHT